MDDEFPKINNNLFTEGTEGKELPFNLEGKAPLPGVLPYLLGRFEAAADKVLELPNINEKEKKAISSLMKEVVGTGDGIQAEDWVGQNLKLSLGQASPEEKAKVIRNVLKTIYLLLISLTFLVACSPGVKATRSINEPPQEQTSGAVLTESELSELTTSTSLTETVLTDVEIEKRFDVNVTEVTDGGLIKTVLSGCTEKSGQECYITDFENLGIAWLKDNKPYAYIKNMTALNSLPAVSNLGFTEEGNKVVWGAVDNVASYVRENKFYSSGVVVIEGEIIDKGNGNVFESVVYSGGIFRQPLRIERSRDVYGANWTGFVGIQEFTTLEEAIRVAIGN